jgi:hypothetical protein
MMSENQEVYAEAVDFVKNLSREEFERVKDFVSTLKGQHTQQPLQNHHAAEQQGL